MNGMSPTYICTALDKQMILLQTDMLLLLDITHIINSAWLRLTLQWYIPYSIHKWNLCIRLKLLFIRFAVLKVVHCVSEKFIDILNTQHATDDATDSVCHQTEVGAEWCGDMNAGVANLPDPETRQSLTLGMRPQSCWKIKNSVINKGHTHVKWE